MHRFFAPQTSASENSVLLPEAEARHALQVLRLGVGDQVELLDGRGSRALGRIENVSKRALTVAVVERAITSSAKIPVDVYLPLAKGKAMDLMIQKTTELGAARIIPIRTQRSVIQLDQDRAENKREKWEAIAVEALKQCGNVWLPQIEEPIAFPESLARLDSTALNLVAALTPQTTSVRRRFDQYQQTNKALPLRVAIWVGPEGDFSPSEYQSFQDAGVCAVSLGTNVLRCETAVIALLAICQQEILSLVSDQ